MRLLMSVFAIGVLVSSCRSATDTAGCLAVQGQFDPRAPGFIIEYKTGTDPIATTAMLSAKYAFITNQLYTAPPGFAAELSTAAVKGIQCESSVKLIEHDGVASLASQ
jgi:hypothetical protein